MNKKLTLGICAGILVAAAGVTVLIFSTEPAAERSGATRETAMLVDVTAVQRGSFRPEIIAMGTVEPVQDVMLSPRVSGQVVERNAAFSPGSFVNEGQVLLRIDPADYEHAVQQARSDLRQAQSELTIEMGRQDVARQDYELVDEPLSQENQALVLREPQLESARAQVESAQAALNIAQTELDRTTIEAPFDARVLSRDVDVGSLVSPGDTLGRLVGVEFYWVATAVPLSKLRWIEFPEDNGQGPPVRVRNRSAWPEDQYRDGFVHSLVGTLEDETRMARVLVVVPDPLAREPGNGDEPRLMLGSFVEARIQAREIEDVMRLSRDHLRENDTVWVMKDGALEIREVEVVLKDAQHAYISSGLEDGEQVVTTNLSTVVEGAKLRTEGGASTGNSEAADEGEPSSEGAAGGSA